METEEETKEAAEEEAEEEEEEAGKADIKSNNPHLTGGEKKIHFARQQLVDSDIGKAPGAV